MEREALTAEGLSHRWPGGAVALDGVSITVRRGELVGVLGPNGAGKSTLVKVVGGIVAPDAGAVRIGADDLRALPARERARRVAYVPQRELLPQDLAVRAFVSLGRSPWASWTGALRRADLEAVGEALRACALEPFADRPLGALSGGEQRRCVTARALAQGARFLLLDEPFASLDVHQQVALCEILRSRADAGDGVLAVFHELNLAAQACDRVLVLRAGRAVAEGPPSEALGGGRVAEVFPCEFLEGRTGDGAPYFVPLSPRSAPRAARTPR